ncbi:MAG: hypothetical protein ACSI46_27095 [Gloeotrichia echinulata DVL01]
MGNRAWGTGLDSPMPNAQSPKSAASNLDHPQGDGVSRRFQ